MRFDKWSYKIELGNEIFRKVNEEAEREKAEKNSKGLTQKGLPCGNGSYNFEKNTKLQKRKRKVYLKRKNEKKMRGVGRRNRVPTSE